MKMKWTEQQQQALEIEGESLIVSAAAGSGKTAVLSERISRLCAKGAELSRILVVTFTEAATAQMKLRIEAQLYKAAEAETVPETARRLRAQALYAGRAHISTLHKFCLYIIKRNYYLLGLDPAFKPLDNIGGSMLLLEALKLAAEALYEASDTAFLELLAAFEGEEHLFETTLSLRSFLMSQPAPWDWLDNSLNLYSLEGTELLAQPIYQSLLKEYCSQANQSIDLLKAGRKLLPIEYTAQLSHLDNEIMLLNYLVLEPKDLSQYLSRLHGIKFNTLTWDKNSPKIDRVCDLRDKAKDIINKQRKKLDGALKTEAEKLAMQKPHLEALFSFVRQVDDIYAALKKERCVIDFSDMEHLALRALADVGVAATLKNKFDYIFVDEYQDSSRIQESIINAIRKDSNIFLVGDVKQSIYRFRQADPGLFIEKLEEFEAQAKNSRAIHLNMNFRSSEPVIDAINAVFSRIMSKEAAELAYDENAALKCAEFNKEAGALAGVEFHLLEFSEFEAVSAKMEARLAAKRIHELMKTGVLCNRLSGISRPLRYSDFAILLRSAKPVALDWAQTLADMGIPAYVQLTGGYFDSMEVKVFLSLLRLLDNRRQDIPLLSALLSPVFGFGEADLIELKTCYTASSFFERLMLCENDAAHPLALSAKKVLNRLEYFQRELQLLPLSEFLAKLLDETGFYNCIGALTNGRERQANLDALLERARDYSENFGESDLWSFLQYMEEAESKVEIGPAQAGAADVVRVLSMHAAKGLEFPIVICAGLGKEFNRSDSKEKLILERTLGAGIKLRIGSVKYETLMKEAIKLSVLNQRAAEEMRVLYVGMSRAQKRLLLIGSTKKLEALIEKAQQSKLSPYECQNAKSFLDWLLPVSFEYEELKVKVHPAGEFLDTPAPGKTLAEPIDNEQALLEALKAHLSWQYPHEAAALTPSKRSVSELLQTKRIESAVPLFVETSMQTPKKRGIAAHAVLANLNFSAYNRQNADCFVKSEVERLVNEGIITKAQAESAPVQEIAGFLRSGLAQRLLKSQRVERELEFSVYMPANTLMQTESTEPVLLQGVIDCCFLENGKWVLLDYKTDAVYKPLEDAAQEHAKQLELYSKALSELTKLPVAKRYVVLLSKDTAVAV